MYVCIVLIQATRPIRKTNKKAQADRWTDRHIVMTGHLLKNLTLKLACKRHFCVYLLTS